MKKIIVFPVLCILFGASTYAQRLMENLDRGVTAVRTADGKVFVSWRLLGTEAKDIGFNVYRSLNKKSEKLNTQPVNSVTHFIDANVDTTKEVSYFVKAVAKGKEGTQSKAFSAADV